SSRADARPLATARTGHAHAETDLRCTARIHVRARAQRALNNSANHADLRSGVTNRRRDEAEARPVLAGVRTIERAVAFDVETTKTGFRLSTIALRTTGLDADLAFGRADRTLGLNSAKRSAGRAGAARCTHRACGSRAGR